MQEDSLRLRALRRPLGVWSLDSRFLSTFFALATLRPDSSTACTCRGVLMDARRLEAVGVCGGAGRCEVVASAEEMARSCGRTCEGVRCGW